MKIHFLGTNGWYDTKTGNTTCTLIETKNEYIVIDAGFGIQKLDKYITSDKPIYIFLTHLHLDHICGLHLFPHFNFSQPVTIFVNKDNVSAFKKIMQHPFTSDFDESGLNIQIKTILPGVYREPFDFRCLPLKHVDGCLGFRFEIDDRIITYCGDTAVCANDKILAKNTDILIHECTLGPDLTMKDWGHSNPEDVAQLAKEARVREVYLTHFGADHYQSKKSRQDALVVARKIYSPIKMAEDDLIVKF